MKIDFNNVKDLYPFGVKSISKGQNKFFCPTCKKTIDEKQFFKTRRTDKHPSGFLPECKTCLMMTVDDTDPLTFLSILKEIDVPYIPSEWRNLLLKKGEKGSSILGKYVSKMRLSNYKNYRWIDSENLAANEAQAILTALRQETTCETEAEQKMEDLMSLNAFKPKNLDLMTNEVSPSALYGLTPQTSKYKLTQEEINKLKADWGEDYTEDQFLQLEQLFNDMQEAYIIQDPIAVSNARIICKMTAKINKFLDIDDIESVAKLSRQLDLFIKSANLAPVQQKDRQHTTFAISQLAFLVEREGGFIPTFYKGKPNDKIDKILMDMQEYTEYLVRKETNISEMVENAENILAEQANTEVVNDEDDFEALEREILCDIETIEEEQGAI